MGEKLHRHLTGKKIYTALRGWEYIHGATEYPKDTETEDEPQSEPDNAPIENTQ